MDFNDRTAIRSLVSKKMHAGDSPDTLGNGSDDNVVRNEPEFPPIPKELEYLIEPGIHYGRKYRFDNDVQWFIENADESDFETLAALAERVRLSGDYLRLMEWMDDVCEVVERIVDERYPYKIDISEQQRKEFLQLINPDIPERQKERCVRHDAESRDHSDVAEARKEMRSRLCAEAHNKVHDMDVYFLFGLMDACDLEFE